MPMKSLRELIPPEFSDVMITYVACKEEVRQEMYIRQKLREIIRPEFFDVNRDEIITRNNSLKIK